MPEGRVRDQDVELPEGGLHLLEHLGNLLFVPDVRPDGDGLHAALFDLIDGGFGRFAAAEEIDRDVGPHVGERQGRGSADSTGSPGY